MNSDPTDTIPPIVKLGILYQLSPRGEMTGIVVGETECPGG